MLKKYKKCGHKSKFFLDQQIIIQDDCDEKYVKIKFNLDDDLPL